MVFTFWLLVYCIWCLSNARFASVRPVPVLWQPGIARQWAAVLTGSLVLWTWLISAEGAGLESRTRQRSMETFLDFQNSLLLEVLLPQDLWTAASLLVCQSLKPWVHLASFFYHALCECMWEQAAVCSALARSTFQNKLTSQCDTLKDFAIMSLVWEFYFFCSLSAVWQYETLKLPGILYFFTFIFLNLVS